MIVAAALFAICVGLAGQKTWEAVDSLLQGDLSTTEVKIAFLGVVTLVLKAVVFYVMATGLYNLFVAPSAVPPAGGVASLADLEIKIAALIILILRATFLERYTSSTDGEDTLLMAAAMGIAVAALVGFQIAIRLDERKSHPPGE